MNFSAFFSHFFVNNLKKKKKISSRETQSAAETLSLHKREINTRPRTRERARANNPRRSQHHEHDWQDGCVEKRGRDWRTSLFIRGREDLNKDEPREDFILLLDEKHRIHLRGISRRVRFECFFVREKERRGSAEHRRGVQIRNSDVFIGRFRSNRCHEKFNRGHVREIRLE